MLSNTEKTMDKIVALCKNRGFIFDGSCCDKYSVMIKYFVSK